MIWADCFENEKTHARESVAALFEPLARELQEFSDLFAAMRREIEKAICYDA